MELLSDPTVWASFMTLTVMEIVLGIDNIVFISVVTNKLPRLEGDRARRIGLSLSLIFRIAFLLLLSWIIGLTEPVFSAFGHDFSWRDIILIAGGIFLIYNSITEIHDEIEGGPEDLDPAKVTSSSFAGVIGQIIVIDLVFSIDSIVTAVGMADHVEVMIAAVTVAMVVMYFASGTISEFIRRHPTTKMLALAFLLLIGVSLVADGFGMHIPRGYIFAAMFFAVLVEAFNSMARRNTKNKTEKSE